jgi:hypothetical protein
VVSAGLELECGIGRASGIYDREGGVLAGSRYLHVFYRVDGCWYQGTDRMSIAVMVIDTKVHLLLIYVD